jgi:hypothetical protein
MYRSPSGTTEKAAGTRFVVVLLLSLLLVCLLVLAVSFLSIRAAFAEEAAVSVSVRVASTIRITGGSVRANIPVVRQISDGFVTYLVP